MNEATSSSATPRTKATAKTTAKAAATKTTRTAAKSTAKTTTKKPTTKRTSKPKTATKRTVGETPAPIINRTSPEQFGRVNVLDITPSAENGLYPARVELGEAFKVTAQVFIEGRTKAGATVSVRNTRGTEKAPLPDDLHQPRPGPLGSDGQDRRPQRPEAVGRRLRRRQEAARRMAHRGRRLGGYVRFLAARRANQGRGRRRCGERAGIRRAAAGTLGWRTRFQADRRRQEDAARSGEGRCRQVARRDRASCRGDHRRNRKPARNQSAARRPERVESAALPRGTSEVELRRMVPVLPAFRRRVFRRRRQDRAGHAEDGAVRPRPRRRPKASTSCTCRRSSQSA